jgi:DNA-binding CsgD family transcriptional regulator
MTEPINPLPPGHTLSQRELEIVTYISRGLNTKQVAGILSLSADTVEAHRHNIIKKTGCNNFLHVVATFLRNGYIS